MERVVRQVVAVAACFALAGGCGRPPKAPPRSSPPPPPLVQAQRPSPARDSLELDTVARSADPQLEGSGAFIDSVFLAQVGQSPRMGWFDRGHFLAEERHPAVYVLAADSTVMTGRFARVAESAEHVSITARAGVACADTAPLGVYDLAGKPLEGETRALFMSRPLARMVRLPLAATQLDAQSRAAVRALLRVSGVPAVIRDTGLAVPGTEFRYSLGAAYDSADHSLLVTALVLRDSAGRVLASATKDSADFECDGCEPPTVESGLGSLYPILSAFMLSGFPYPVLLLNTSTVEGRALSLVTFTPRGEYAEYRLYEYVVNCISRGDQ